MMYGGKRAAIVDWFVPIVARYLEADGSVYRRIQRLIHRARLGVTPEVFLARTVAIGCGVGVLSGVLGGVVVGVLYASGILVDAPVIGLSIQSESVRTLLTTVRVPLLIVVVSLVVGALGFFLGIAIGVIRPVLRANRREREINYLLSDAVSYMYALSVGGMNHFELIQALAAANDTYGEVAREFRSIERETTVFDTDYRTAIRRQAMRTPSDELSRFLTDLLSILTSGGNLESFLADEAETLRESARHEQKRTLDTLEVFGEVYMTLSLFPLLLVVILVVMVLLGEGSASILGVVIYGLLPLTGVGFLTLIATVTPDDPGDGRLTPVRSSDVPWLADTDAAGNDVGTRARAIQKRVRSRRMRLAIRRFSQGPHRYFRDHPLHTAFVSVPLVGLALGIGIFSGFLPVSWSGLKAAPILGTAGWLFLPLYGIVLPYGVFVEWNRRRRFRRSDGLTRALRKLASANDTGLTLLDSFQTVGSTADGPLASEFRAIHTEVTYGTRLRSALIGFTNRVGVPRVARTMKLIANAQEVSSDISEVLSTAARISETHDELARDRDARTRMQLAIVGMSFLTMLAVLALLQAQFVDSLTEAATVETAGVGTAGSIDRAAFSLMFFHAVVMHGLQSGLIVGYMREDDLAAGIKYALAMASIALLVWSVVA